jgi:hypothetical protein
MDPQILVSPKGLLIAWQDSAGQWMSIDRDAPSRVVRLCDTDVVGWTPLVPAASMRQHYVTESRRQHAVVQDARRYYDALRTKQRQNPGSVTQERVDMARHSLEGAKAVEAHVCQARDGYPRGDQDTAVTS